MYINYVQETYVITCMLHIIIFTWDTSYIKNKYKCNLPYRLQYTIVNIVLENVPPIQDQSHISSPLKKFYTVFYAAFLTHTYKNYRHFTVLNYCIGDNTIRYTKTRVRNRCCFPLCKNNRQSLYIINYEVATVKAESADEDSVQSI